jgi:pimeloyl-ACP methyl ester carboxylesterase
MYLRTRHGIEVHVDETGDGEPILYLHSGPGRGGDWRSVVECLGPTRHHICPDLYDRGRSDRWPDEATYSLDRHVETASDVIDAHGGRAHVVGHSYGGAIAVRLAVLSPERVASLTAIEPQLIDLLRDAGETSLHASVIETYGAVLGALSIGDDERGWTLFIDEFNGRGAWVGLPDRVKDRVRAQGPRMPVYFAALRDNPVGVNDVAGLDAPTLVVLGANTTPAERRMAEIVAEYAPRATCVEIENAAHMAPLTHPQEVASALADHLSAHPLQQ